MKKFLALALLAGLGATLTATDAQAFGGRRKKNKDCCPAPAPVAVSPCGGTVHGHAVASPCGGVTYATVGGTTTSTSAYTPVPVPMPATGSTTATTTDKPATITVMVPSADAQVWFDDNLVTQTGKERTLTTGNLADGKSYDYTVKAKWTDENGKKVEKTRNVTVKAGQTSTADFR
jgi:uncharacterized protein (TIGR03000 family)